MFILITESPSLFRVQYEDQQESLLRALQQNVGPQMQMVSEWTYTKEQVIFLAFTVYHLLSAVTLLVKFNVNIFMFEMVKAVICVC